MAKMTVNFISYKLMRTIDITVVIPSVTFPECFGDGNIKGAAPTHRLNAKYPVLYLMHGAGNNHATWTGYTNIELFAEERNIAVVMISGENQMYVNNERNKFYDFINEELPEFIQSMFPVSDRPEDTYIAGLSMGSMGSLVHFLSNPAKYRAMGAFSAGLFLPPSDMSGNPFEDRYNPEVLAKNLKEQGITGLDMFLSCGDGDPLFEGCKKSAEILTSYGQNVTWQELPNYIHEWRFWNITVEAFLDWLPRTDAYAALGKRKI